MRNNMTMDPSQSPSLLHGATGGHYMLNAPYHIITGI